MRGFSTEGVNTDSTVCHLFGPCVAVCCNRDDQETGCDDELCVPCGDDSNRDGSPIPESKYSFISDTGN